MDKTCYKNVTTSSGLQVHSVDQLDGTHSTVSLHWSPSGKSGSPSFRDRTSTTKRLPASFGYNLQEVLDDLFEGTAGHERMSREFRAFLLTADKSSTRPEPPPMVPRARHRLVRFVLAAALACCDLDDVWFTEGFEILTEMGVTLYDAVAFYKHRAEGEMHSTFGYMSVELRIKSFHLALDAAWAQTDRPYHHWHQAVINFTRFFGGPIHMLMRRYRFVEDALAIGKPEDEHVVDQTRQNYKLWHRNDAEAEVKSEDRKGYCRYKYLVTERPEPWLNGGLLSFHTRAAKVFPELLQVPGYAEKRAGTDAELRISGYDEYGSVLSEVY
ncbi:hypothetical protein DFH08DRAFT_955329 [Mycena albidolilacea]|uniref:Uncharacterized protein n=1 Tax=Mycena albidolilacea TaxID=1033008 RepID=A0AAD7ADN7_9AGAR|nr:hypothetical protein DFH08DRAFT_955329 [Mycena albidolilacea]